METRQEFALRRSQIQLVNDLDPKDVLDHLYEDGILTENDYERINSGKTRKERCRIMLAMLPSRGPGAYGSFQKALLNNYPHLEKILVSFSEQTNDLANQVNLLNIEGTYDPDTQGCEVCYKCIPYIPNDFSDHSLENVVKRHCCLLLKNVEALDLLDLLYQEFILDRDECDKIRSEKTRKERITVLLQELSKCKRSNVFSVFKTSLKKKYGFIVETIEKECMETNPKEVIQLELARPNMATSENTPTTYSGETHDQEMTYVKSPSFTKSQESQIPGSSLNASSFGRSTSTESMYQWALPGGQQNIHGSSASDEVDSSVVGLDEPDGSVFRNTSNIKVSDLHDISQASAQTIPVSRTLNQYPLYKENIQLLQDNYTLRNSGCIEVESEGFLRLKSLDVQPEVSSLLQKTRITNKSKSDSESESEEDRPHRKRKTRLKKEKTCALKHCNTEQIQTNDSGNVVAFNPGSLKPNQIPSRRLEVAFNFLSTMINQGQFERFEQFVTTLKHRYSHNNDMLCILSYLNASKDLFKTNFDSAKAHIDSAMELVPKTSNPKYFMLELFTALTRMYISQKKLEKLRNTLDDAKMIIETDPVGCTGRAAGWLYMNDARNTTAVIAMLNVHKSNYLNVYKTLHEKAKRSFHLALVNFQKDGGKDGPFGFGYALCRLAILLLQCGDNGLTMSFLHPDPEDIKLAGGYVSQLEDSDIPIPKILEVHFLIAKCDYQYRRNNTVRALEYAEGAYKLATEISMLEFTDHAHNRAVFLKTQTPLLLETIDEAEASKILLESSDSN